jgi:hypothetical protein
VDRVVDQRRAVAVERDAPQHAVERACQRIAGIGAGARGEPCGVDELHEGRAGEARVCDAAEHHRRAREADASVRVDRTAEPVVVAAFVDGEDGSERGEQLLDFGRIQRRHAERIAAPALDQRAHLRRGERRRRRCIGRARASIAGCGERVDDTLFIDADRGSGDDPRL